jgi:hypothetical protein
MGVAIPAYYWAEMARNISEDLIQPPHSSLGDNRVMPSGLINRTFPPVVRPSEYHLRPAYRFR